MYDILDIFCITGAVFYLYNLEYICWRTQLQAFATCQSVATQSNSGNTDSDYSSWWWLYRLGFYSVYSWDVQSGTRVFALQILDNYLPLPTWGVITVATFLEEESLRIENTYEIRRACIFLHEIWVNYNDLTATSLESCLVRGIIPKWPYFRLVKYYNLPRWNSTTMVFKHFIALTTASISVFRIAMIALFFNLFWYCESLLKCFEWGCFTSSAWSPMSLHEWLIHHPITIQHLAQAADSSEMGWQSARAVHQTQLQWCVPTPKWGLRAFFQDFLPGRKVNPPK